MDDPDVDRGPGRGGPLYDLLARGHSVELLGKETIAGREVVKLRVTLRSGDSHTDYLDGESALLVRRESSRTIGEPTIELQGIFGDFRLVDGVMFPRSIVHRDKAGADTLPIVVEQAELNVPTDDASFARLR